MPIFEGVAASGAMYMFRASRRAWGTIRALEGVTVHSQRVQKISLENTGLQISPTDRVSKGMLWKLKGYNTETTIKGMYARYAMSSPDTTVGTQQQVESEIAKFKDHLHKCKTQKKEMNIDQTLTMADSMTYESLMHTMKTYHALVTEIQELGKKLKTAEDKHDKIMQHVQGVSVLDTWRGDLRLVEADKSQKVEICFEEEPPPENQILVRDKTTLQALLEKLGVQDMVTMSVPCTFHWVPVSELYVLNNNNNNSITVGASDWMVQKSFRYAVWTPTLLTFVLVGMC